MQSGFGKQAQTTRSIDRVPPEVLARVFELAHDGPADSSRTLRSASLVCGRWRDPAQRELFSHVTLDLLMTPAKADAWLASPARGRYRIQSLSVTEGEGSGQEVEEALKALSGDDPANHITHSFHHIAARITTLSLTIEDEDSAFSKLLTECSALERLEFTTPALPADSPTTFLRRYNELLDRVVLSLPPSQKIKHVYLYGLGAPQVFENEDEYHSNAVALVVYALLSALAGPALSGLMYLAFPDLKVEDFDGVYGGPALSAVMEECASRSVVVAFGDGMV
ncbi:hypothetical protein RQP46_009055 [Phenoliferia psychrophenolica]